jgi:membrane dipeptidase
MRSSPNIPVFDGHNDSLTADGHERLSDGKPDGHLDLPRMRAGGVRAAIFAAFTRSEGDYHATVARDDGVLEFQPAPPVAHEHAAAVTNSIVGRLLAMERAGAIKIARQIADIDRAAADVDAPPTAIMHFEGAEPIDRSLDALYAYHAAGLRSLGLVWSRPNTFANGVPFLFPSSPDTGPGLTELGIKLTKRCADLGILIDLAHMNEAGFWDTERLELGPLVVTHAGVHAIAPCSRNVTDQQLDAIARTGGLIGIAFACSFLRPDFKNDAETTPLTAIVRHVRYVADRIGVEHVAFGSDFDGATIPAALGGADGYPKLIDALREDGFSETEIRAIAWENWRRVLDSCWH